MRRIKPNYYEAFQCLGGDCPMTCCQGMVISIDEASLEKYRAIPGRFGRLVMASIDEEGQAFCQDRRGCLLLTKEGLCSLQKELGEEYLCETCRVYPRHVEEFPSVREYSLGLSCPQGCRLLLASGYGTRYEMTEDGEEDPYSYEPDEEETYGVLGPCRDVLLTLLHAPEGGLGFKEAMVIRLGERLQEAYDEGVLSQVEPEELLQKVREEVKVQSPGEGREVDAYQRLVTEYGYLHGLGVVGYGFSEILREYGENALTPGEGAYEALSEGFLRYASSWEADGLSYGEAMESLLAYYVYVYLAGATYDGEILASARLACFAREWVEELLKVRWKLKGECFGIWDIVELSVYLSKQLEHDEENLRFLLEKLGVPEN